MRSNKEHWDEIFATRQDNELGWYEKEAVQSFKLLNRIPDWEKSTIFLVGAGTTTLADELLGRGAKLIINDISSEALEKLKNAIGEKCSGITWLCQDISKPIRIKLPEVNIWIDRAVLHFLNDEADIKGYFRNVDSCLKKGGYALFAEFSKNGATKCACLPVHRYSANELSERLGSSFKLIEDLDFTYINPFGDQRPYIYTLFKRI
ncbi:MAG TPA: methyltransferase type 12 [Lentisphaeria bacterium]|nr:MAG: methyltransferase type 12 [Lentisphaerae bacterium GWF2_38_69]HBM17313.1 methyltransferase type 12 [Lentisphaeria bacterium]